MIQSPPKVLEQWHKFCNFDYVASIELTLEDENHETAYNVKVCLSMKNHKNKKHKQKRKERTMNKQNKICKQITITMNLL